MAARDRLDIIEEMVINEKKVTVSKLSHMFDVTEETIRRDLEKLDGKGIVIRTYGGAVLNIENKSEGIPFFKRASINIESKQVIARKALELIKEGATLFADSSSTVMEVLKLIKDRTDITVITNSVEVLHELNQSDLKILSTGGAFKKSSSSLIGIIAKNAIKNYHVEIALVSCKGMDINEGIMDSSDEEVEIKKQMIEQANNVILLIDHTKFDKLSLVKLFDFNNIDYIVTEKEPGIEWREFLKSNNIKILY
ncbi:DeoR/GlpR family DNA-binding transcription regulator [Clostridium estertheticum]|uniref:DeoR/GlpR family DNA-binding transcription regulator n=1 Tax=Clostridium estertheticum TaxID=238834 RepID=UPI001C0DC88C|nr:DeoR/GlpR family DNA-binding transcription regulator [Clostridium estertheticum]MBU3215571.1 DeoR/GlpR family DNA-binding transcription regulator [Clostridium estertheticum]WAG56811.1 DeoR/GlpR family DNA-binding transcription regulator [Clostridium estertheticum]